MNINSRPWLNSARPTVNRQFLTDEQLKRRAMEIAEKSLTTAGEGTLISTGVNLVSNQIHEGKTKPGESISHAALHGGIAGGVRALYEFGKDAVDTYLTGRVAENTGEYAPNIKDPKVHEAIMTIAQQELDDDSGWRIDKDHITTPTLDALGLCIKYPQK